MGLFFYGGGWGRWIHLTSTQAKDQLSPNPRWKLRQRLGGRVPRAGRNVFGGPPAAPCWGYCVSLAPNGSSLRSKWDSGRCF